MFAAIDWKFVCKQQQHRQTEIAISVCVHIHILYTFLSLVNINSK